MRFQVPQFIDIEDKIFGPFTFKQFIYLAGGAGSAYAIWKLLPTIIAIFIVLPIIGIALALTFYKVNGKPFIEVMQSYAAYSLKSKLFIWKQRKVEKKKKFTMPAKPAEHPMSNIPKLTESRLSDISWSLDVLDMGKRDK
jgi:hypothetical protein